jgi:hypothetical protein
MTMISTYRAAIALAVAALSLAGCNRDAQTEGKVTTKAGAGEVSTSVSGDSADKRGEALVRVVNAASTAEGLIVRSDETHALPAVEYRKVTPYQPIDRNWVTFQVSSQPGNNYVPLATNRELLTDGYRYTMIIMRDKDGTGLETRVLRDVISSDVTRAHLRVVHAAQGIDEVNVVARGMEKIFDAVNFTSEAGFKDIDPWKGTLEFRTNEGNRLLKTVPNVNLEAGKSYTIILTRDAKGKVDAFWIEDEQVN